MQTAKVNTRDFLRNYKNITSSQKTVIVFKGNNPEGVYMPYLKWNQKYNRNKISVKNLEKYFFEANENLSKEVDLIY